MAILPIHSTVITPFGPKTNPLWPVGIYLFEGICKNPQIVAETRKTYAGPLQAGEDLMSFDITDAGVTVNPPPR